MSPERGKRRAISDSFARASARAFRRRIVLSGSYGVVVMLAWPVLEGVIRQSADHVLVGLFLPYFLLTVLSLIVVWTFAYLIKRKVIEFAMEAVRDGRLDSKDAPKFVAELHGALKHGTVPGRGRRAA